MLYKPGCCVFTLQSVRTIPRGDKNFRVQKLVVKMEKKGAAKCEEKTVDRELPPSKVIRIPDGKWPWLIF